MTDTQIPAVADAVMVAPSTTVSTLEEENTSKSTLFVRGLPFDASNEQLEAFFSEIGPVRSCFVVLDRSGQQSATESSDGKENKSGVAVATKTPSKNKGYGFVQFVLPDDADKAINELRGVKFLKQRPLLIEKAVKKTHDGESKPKKELNLKPKGKNDKPKKSKEASDASEEPKEKNYSFQTIVLNGLGKDITKKHVYKKVRKVGDVKEVIYPVIAKAPEGSTGGEEAIEGTAHVIYGTSALAASAVQALDGHIFKGYALHAALLASPAVYKRCRLIVRNLPWKYREAELRALFIKFGTIHDVSLPRKYEGGPLRGFGFVQMENLQAAEKAIASLNGTEHHDRVIAVDWALAKDRFEEAEAKAQVETSTATTETTEVDQDIEMEDISAENDVEDEESEEAGTEELEDEDGEDEDVELNLDHLKDSDEEEAEDSDEEIDAEDAASLAALDAEEAEENK
ncbi:RNA recognition motif-containing protein, partial [Modicella reniformis]